MAQKRSTTRERKVIVHDELVERARQAVGGDDLTASDLLRLGLAQLAGVNVEDWTPKRGWPEGRPRRTQAAA